MSYYLFIYKLDESNKLEKKTQKNTKRVELKRASLIPCQRERRASFLIE